MQTRALRAGQLKIFTKSYGGKNMRALYKRVRTQKRFDVDSVVSGPSL